VEIGLTDQAQTDLRRFGWAKAFLLRDELEALIDEAGLVARLRPLPKSPDAPQQFRVDLTAPFVAILRPAQAGLVIERVLTTDEIAPESAKLFESG
jgi:hypothetical protein